MSDRPRPRRRTTTARNRCTAEVRRGGTRQQCHRAGSVWRWAQLEGEPDVGAVAVPLCHPHNYAGCRVHLEKLVGVAQGPA